MWIANAILGLAKQLTRLGGAAERNPGRTWTTTLITVAAGVFGVSPDWVVGIGNFVVRMGVAMGGGQ